ncbi:hypothetical protein [Gilvimarinus sp. DA14]|uniref:hypothetical protein n=1 Tax=Gilvimarinus sp. DA14 TaxID=2956798 RepID=UPI0020B64F01|nr:hypothetical protein [Gilvimarinus sp. DA14]UTF59172.1 hypothetical protein NHM04_11870 [Gilvimarinus sp. DA14]
MTAIWLIYLQFFYFSYRRSNRPFMIIHQAQGDGPEAPCLFVNMSKEPIHVQSIVAYLDTGEGLRSCFITDYQRHSPEDTKAGEGLREGPIQPGGYLVLGSFNDIFSCHPEIGGERGNDHQALNGRKLEICVAVTHGPSEHLIGARRVFRICQTEKATTLQAHSIYTEQLTSRRKCKDVRRWVQERFRPEQDSEQEDRGTEQKVR